MLPVWRMLLAVSAAALVSAAPQRAGSRAAELEAFSYPTTVVIGPGGKILLYRSEDYAGLAAFLKKLFSTSR